MSTRDDVRRISLGLPGVVEAPDGFAFELPGSGKRRGFAWGWRERIHAKKPRVDNLDVVVIVVRSLTEKQILIDADPTKYFTEPHYNGFPAVLVRLSAVTEDELKDLLVEAWRSKAPPDLASAFDEEQ